METNHLLVIILVIQILTCVSIFILIGNLDSAIIDLKKFCYNFTSSTSKGDITSPQIIIPANNSTDINIKILGG